MGNFFSVISGKNIKIGFYYLILDIVTLFLTILYWPFSLILIWPLVSISIIILGYFYIGEKVYEKKNGIITLRSRFLMAPILFGQYISLLYYKKKCKKYNEVIDNLIIGRKLNDKEARDAINEGIKAVVDMTSEFSEAKPFLSINYMNINTLDLTAPSRECIYLAVHFIEKNIKEGKVYVHCKIGYSRSAVVTGAYLLKTGYAKNTEDAIWIIKEKRSSLIVRKEAYEALKDFEASMKIKKL